jgi:DNA mismatch repair protein MLH3
MFLASLSAVSLLTITSRHHQHRSHNSVTFHHAKTVERQLPAPSQHDIAGKHGTRVTVRNLFGNMPVKQRSKVVEQKAESDRLWETAKASAVGLLLSWGGSVSLRARDVNNRLVFSFGVSDLTRTVPSLADVSKPYSAHLTSILSILTQSNYISVEERSSWVPVSASTSALSIKGAISLLPAPSRSLQFISLGLHPLAAETEHNELYDEVNRLFRLSSFGTVEDDADIDHAEKVRRQSDKRYKADGYTNQSLKARKGVDRYPMFHLRISLRTGSSAGVSEERFIDDGTNIQTVLEILGAMVTQWLSAHHFRPVHARQKRARVGSSATGRAGSTEDERPQTSATVDVASLSSSKTPRRGKADMLTRKSKSAGVVAARDVARNSQHRAFAEWSRIKSGRANFFTQYSELPKTGLRVVPTTHFSKETGGITGTTSNQQRSAVCAEFSMQRTVSTLEPSADRQEDEAGLIATDVNTHDDTITWKDPSTNKTYTLNARTGCAVPLGRAAPNLDSPSGTSRTSHAHSKVSLRLPAKTEATGKTPWLDDVFKTWDNPVFNTSQQQIEKVSLREDKLDQDMRQHVHHRCSHAQKDNDSNAFPVLGSDRLSKGDMSSAEVIAQVDRKFILVKVKTSHDTRSPQETLKALLVLIDQHAADERIQVETLFRELCAPTPPSSSNYRSKLGHSSQVASTILDKAIQFTVSESEQRHFTTHAARFAAWGILFDVPDSSTIIARSGTNPETQRLLSVTALPPSISERCKADVGLLINFLRSTVWKYASDPHLPPHAPIAADETPINWVRRLASCPEGLVQMVNSRACRSAIMFNDELDLGACKALVRRLATCVFPFICAHGRPSLVPLVDVEGYGGSVGGETARPGGFVRKWIEWKQ